MTGILSLLSVQGNRNASTGQKGWRLGATIFRRMGRWRKTARSCRADAQMHPRPRRLLHRSKQMASALEEKQPQGWLYGSVTTQRPPGFGDQMLGGFHAHEAERFISKNTVACWGQGSDVDISSQPIRQASSSFWVWGRGWTLGSGMEWTMEWGSWHQTNNKSRLLKGEGALSQQKVLIFLFLNDLGTGAGPKEREHAHLMRR